MLKLEKERILPLLLSLCLSLELLQYFNLLNGGGVGFSVHVGRLYQFFIIPFLLIYAASIRLAINKYVLFAAFPYLICVVLIGVVSACAYLFGWYGEEVSGFRPLMEYILYIYQLSVFCFLPVLLIKSKNQFICFLNYLRLVILFSIIVGIIDFLIRGAFGYDLLARAVYDGVDVGGRFHGMFGEPRDAAVALLFYGLIETLLNFYKRGSLKLSKRKIFLLMLLLLMTQSFSFIIGVFVSFLLLVFFSPNFVFVQNFRLSFVFLFLSLALLLILSYFERMQRYFDGVSLALTSVFEKDFSSLPPVFSGQLPNLYPAAVFFERLWNVELGMLLLGSGLGSVAYVNAESGFWPGELINPHSNILRVAIDFGVLGGWFYVFSQLYVFWSASKRLCNRGRRNKVALTLFSVLLVGASLAHRSPVIIMSLGIMLLAISFVDTKHSDRKQEIK